MRCIFGAVLAVTVMTAGSVGQAADVYEYDLALVGEFQSSFS